MKIHSMQFKVLMTVISAMLAISVFVGGLSIFEVDKFVQRESEDYLRVTCEKEVSQINDIFGDMEKSVHIMESFVFGLINSKDDIYSAEKLAEIINRSDEMFIDVAKNTDGVVAYYFRFNPEISREKGLFYSKENGKSGFVRFEPTDILLYDRNDTEHVGWYWQPYVAGEPVWMEPYYNKNNDIMMISYVVPMYLESEFIGVVGMDFDYTVLTDKVNNIKIYDNGFANLEFDGKDNKYTATYSGDSKLNKNPEKHLSVSQKLKNGMNLVISASYDDIRQIRYDIAFKIIFVVILLAILFSVIVILVVRRIVHPLKKLTDASIRFSNGDYEVASVHSNTYEIRQLSNAFENMALHLKEHEKMHHLLAYRDSLTGLRNTNSYWAWITDFDKEIETEEIVFGIMVLDINYLKETNDRYGHDIGNKLIVSAAHIISTIFKRSPVFRIGGDEFLVILQNRDLDELDTLVKKFDEECLNEIVETENENIPVSIAKGFARYDSQKDSNFIDVFNRADDAMYENKREIKGLK